MLGKVGAALILTLFLTSCVEVGSRLIEDAAYLHQSGRDYVREVHDFRRWVRAECRAILVREVEDLQKSGQYEEARKRLVYVYPDLVTIDMARQSSDDPTGILASPFGCN